MTLRTKTACASALLGALLLGLFGCPPGDLSGTCRFTGDNTTACGMCVAQSCQSFVNSCCADDLCEKYDLPALDSCTGSSDCSKLSGYGVSGDTMGKVASCVSANCSAQCGGVDAGIKTAIACTKPTHGSCNCLAGVTDGGSSSASSATDPSTVCSFSTLVVRCCADTTWPAIGTSCGCTQVTCAYPDGQPSDCQCGYGDVPSGYNALDECMPTFDGKCCKSADGSCRCAAVTDCGTATEVPSCKASDSPFTCSSTTRQVTSCSGQQ